ncbi:hypothetical protein BJ508DRAFT_367566 [Ascobolus immersus RN42]|uniref:Uncharacterized protein n=1 Tax=Ascobolus immersus RN42 TaxID=1160509 RepID=A0A3N4HF88_ASCIM|nr:hypothetical protein BJ508DRAFT_367566 [Ascobolus immersus RN42]
MAKSRKPKTSSAVRELGTKLYKDGNFQEAAEKFEEAASLDPADPAPLRALSGALFELGQYEQCVSVIQKALSVETDEEKIKSLKLREKKCHFQLRSWDSIVEQLEGVSLGQEEQNLVTASQQYNKSAHDGLGWEEVVDFPRTRPKAGPAEYYPHGHDEPSAAYSDEDLLKMKNSLGQSGQLDLSLLYGGIGDGRHFFQQLNHVISYFERMRSSKSTASVSDDGSKDKFEFVLQDIKEQAIARLLILISLIDTLSKRQVENLSTREASLERQELETTITYTFAASVMPPWAYERMRTVVSSLIANSQVTNGVATFGIPWIEVPSRSAEAVVDVLKYWLADSEGILGKNSVEAIQDGSKLEVPAEAEEYMQAHPDIAAEFLQHKETRMAPPPANMARVKEPALFELLNKQMSETEKTSKLKQYTAKHWKPNVTQIQEEAWFTWGSGDLDDSMLLQPQTSHIGEYVSNVWNEATEYYGNLVMARHMVKARQSAKPYLNSIERISPWFSAVARVFGEKAAELKVVLVADEVNHQLDEYRFGVHTKKKSFDAIYLSNIPDYTGGHLSTLLYALPTLKESNKEAFVQSNSIFATSLFTEGLSHTIAEYLCLPDLAVARDLFGLSFQDTPLMKEVYKAELTQATPFGPLMFFHRWEAPTKNPFKLPNKLWFLRWLAQMLLKILLPVVRNYRSSMMMFMGIEQPLTVYTFFRLCQYLVDRGIPRHWISSFLDPIVSTGLLNTSVTPPGAAPLSSSATINPYWPLTRKATGTDRSYDLRPFLPELRTHLSIFQQVLPLSLTTSNLIPAHPSLARFSLQAETIAHVALFAPWQQVLQLTFFNPDSIDAVEAFDKPGWLRDQIVGGQQKDKSFNVGKNTIFVTGFTWKHESTESRVKGLMPFRKGVAEWVMEKSVWEMMKEKGWRVLLVKTDDWTLVSEEHKIGEVKMNGEFP